jgi:hypothetical protein
MNTFLEQQSDEEENYLFIYKTALNFPQNLKPKILRLCCKKIINNVKKAERQSCPKLPALTVFQKQYFKTKKIQTFIITDK